MNPRDDPQREEMLVGAMADYDEALAAGAATERIDDTVAKFDPQLAAEWARVKECLDLLDRARRNGVAESGINDECRMTNDECNGLRQSSSVLRHSESVVSARGLLPEDPHPKHPHPGPLPEGEGTGRHGEGRCRRLGRFVLERELGRGGLGIVYLAHDPQLGRKVALKVPRFEALLDDDLRRRFLREAEAAARLNHPNLVALYEVGEDNSICYLASEYCPGPTLAQWLRSRGDPVPPAEAAKLVSVLAGAVEHAHSRGVLHRDIKPSNVLLEERGAGSHPEGTRQGARGREQLESWPLARSPLPPAPCLLPKLTDFGMAKLLEQGGAERTRTGAIVGTLAYMAPEQVEGRVDQLDARTDVYALGAILYELLTGTRPYGGQSDVEVLRQLIANEPVAPRKLRPNVPRDLEAITLKCLSRNPAGRYATAGALADDLERFLNGRPTAARRLGASARLMKWARRRPAIAALGMVTVVAAALVAGINARRIEDNSRALEESNQLRTLASQERQRALDEEATTHRLLYASRMRKAQQAWRDGNRGSLQEMLKYYADGTPDAGLRHFEWYYLNHLANSPHRMLRGHSGRVYAVACSPDGKFVVSGGADGTVRLWDASTGESEAVFHEHQDAISSLVFSPDGDTFATSSGDKTVKLWSLSQRKPISTLPHPFPVDACAFLDGGKLLGSLSSEIEGRREALLWDAPTGTLRPAWAPLDEHFQAVIAGQSGRTAVTFAKNFATVWNREDDSWVASRRMDVVNPRAGATLSPDEEYLLVPVWPRYVHSYRLSDGVLANAIKDHGGGVNCISFSPTGDQIATSSDDTSVCVFDFPSGKLVHRFFGHEGGAVWQVAWAPSGDALASVGNDGMVRVWDIAQGSLCRHLRLPEPRSRASRGQLGFGHLQETGLWGFALSQDGQRVNAVYQDGLNLTWDGKTGRWISSDEVSGSVAPVSGGVVTPFPEPALTQLPQWDSQAYSIPTRLGRESDGRATRTESCARIVGDGSQIIEIGNGRLRRWSLQPFELIEERRIDNLPAPGAPELIFDVTQDGRRVCGANVNGNVYICDLDRGTIVHLGNFIYVGGAGFSPDGDRIVVVHGDGVHEYDSYSGSQIRRYANEVVTAIRYSADAQRIAIAFEPGYACIYDTLTGEETLRLDVRASEILFEHDGTSIVTDGAQDGGLYYWPGKK